MIAKPSSKLRRGALHLSTAQWLVFALALLCGVIVFNVYQANTRPPRALPIALPNSSRSQIALTRNLGQWQNALKSSNIALTCPYLGHDYVARIDLPERRPVTLDPWDYGSEAIIAHNAYVSFFKARQEARVANPPGCLVHVFDSTGEEVARADQSGVVTSQFAPIPGS